MHVGERGELEDDRLGPAGERRQRRREHESEDLVLIGLVAERDRAWLVLADRLEHLAEGRVDDPVDEGEPDEEHRRDEVVHQVLVLEVAARHALDAVLAAGELRAQAVEVEHLRQRERDHREIDALAPDGDDADHQPQRGAHRHREEDRELGWPSPDQRRVRARVAGSAEEERMAK